MTAQELMDEAAGPTPPEIRDQMLAELYDELRAAAGRLLSREAPTLTVRPTELVNEAGTIVNKADPTMAFAFVLVDPQA